MQRRGNTHTKKHKSVLRHREPTIKKEMWKDMWSSYDCNLTKSLARGQTRNNLLAIFHNFPAFFSTVTMSSTIISFTPNGPVVNIKSRLPEAFSGSLPRHCSHLTHCPVPSTLSNSCQPCYRACNFKLAKVSLQNHSSSYNLNLK